jgi:hypothetical protein
VKSRPPSAYLSVAALSCSAGAQVLAGVDGSLTLWQLVWLFLSFATTALGGFLAIEAERQKKKKVPARAGVFPTFASQTP